MEQYAWITGPGAFLLSAESEDEAYRKVIANRIAAGQTPEEAVTWFEKDDQLHKIDGEVTDAPYQGELPAEGEDDFEDDEDWDDEDDED